MPTLHEENPITAALGNVLRRVLLLHKTRLGLPDRELHRLVEEGGDL